MSLIINVLVILLWAVVILVFVRVALTWISPYPRHEWQRIVFRITDPMLTPLRRWIPPVSGLDLSPLVLTVAIYFLIAALRSIS